MVSLGKKTFPAVTKYIRSRVYNVASPCASHLFHLKALRIYRGPITGKNIRKSEIQNCIEQFIFLII